MGPRLNIIVSSLLIVPLVTGQCNPRIPLCRSNCHCKNQAVCPSYLSSYGCGNDGCLAAWSGPYCKRENIALGLADDHLGSSGYLTQDNMPRHAVDGSLSTWYSSTEDDSPYLWINTGGYNVINTLKITTYGNFKIDISNGTNFTDSQQCYTDGTSSRLSEYNVKCTKPVIGKYVRVQLQGRGYLNIYEIDIYRCADYWFGDQCDKLCTCQNQTEVCHKTTGRCMSGCATGYMGTHCLECLAGRYGRNCGQTCGNCKEVVCNRNTGECLKGCVEGYDGSHCNECQNGLYGLNCSNRCGNCALTSCNKENGSCPYGCTVNFGRDLCKDCTDGFYGEDCSLVCGHCLQSHRCNRNGTCPQGCDPGYGGEGCNTNCPSERFGPNCVGDCHCKEASTCNVTNGHCPEGCAEGYTGTTCQQCKDGRYGKNCSETCGHCMGDSTCNKTSGACASGCEPAYKEPLCKDEYESNTFGSDSNVTSQQTLNTAEELNDNNHSAIFGSVGAVAGVIVIAVVVSVFVIRRRFPNLLSLSRRKKNHDDRMERQASDTELNWSPERSEQIENDPTYVNASSTELPDTSINVMDIDSSISWKLTNRRVLEKEFEALPKGVLEPTKAALEEHNVRKCRYMGLIPYDHNRVILETINNDPTTDFMNASFVKSYCEPKAFIASQGPTETNIKEFWRMVWQFKVQKIIMLSNLFESGKEKVRQYWRNEGVVKYGDISIETVFTQHGIDVTVRTFQIFKSNDTRTVMQFHYLDWPDHGAPRDTTGIIDLRDKVDGTVISLDAPVVVHCSAGVGRSGTYIAFNNIMEQLESEPEVDIYQHVTELRHQRTQMVQTTEQYIFLHSLVKDGFLCRGSSFTTEKMMSLELSSPSSNVRFQQEFENLNKLRVEKNAGLFKAALSDDNNRKNKHIDNIPADVNRICLSVKVAGRNDYINAQFIPGERGQDKMIVTQIPFGDTRVDFWRLVYQTKSTSIILLNRDIRENEKYWPSDDMPMVMGPFIVKLISQESKEGFTLRAISVIFGDDENNPPHVVQQYNCDNWAGGQTIPKSPGDFINLRSWITSRKNLDVFGPVIVHCRDSCERSALFCVTHWLLDRLESERSVNVLLSVKRMRGYCMNAVSSLSQYRFCYEVVQAYLENFNT